MLPFILAGALLYSSVGHGGATIYLAVLTLAGYDVAQLATLVLALNIIVSSIAFVSFRQAGHLRAGLLVPFVVTSVPMAYVGGRVPLALREQALLLGLALLAAALRFLLVPRPPNLRLPRTRLMVLVFSPLLGGLLGFLAGATGIGGGIFLSPLIVAFGWGGVREAGSVASAFIALNSATGLAPRLARVPIDVGMLVPLAAVVAVGGVTGSYMGAFRLPPRALQILLGLVLLAAAFRAVL